MTKSTVVKLPERGENTAKAVSDFVRDHPVAVVAGGVALGLLAGAVLSRGTGRKLVRQALTLAEVAGAASVALGRQAVDKAEEAGGQLRRGSSAVAGKAAKLAEPAEEAVDAASDAAHRLLRKAVDLAGKLRG